MAFSIARFRENIYINVNRRDVVIIGKQRQRDKIKIVFLYVLPAVYVRNVGVVVL